MRDKKVGEFSAAVHVTPAMAALVFVLALTASDVSAQISDVQAQRRAQQEADF